jgi:exosortase
MLTNSKLLAALAVLAASVAVVYRDVVPALVRDWMTDDNYSHGFLIVPIALYFVWERRERLMKAAWKPSLLGAFVTAASLAVLAVGTLGAEMFLTRLSIVGVIAGAVLFVGGWQHLRVLAFPIAFLLLMIPLPAILFNQIAFPLQLLASRVGEASLAAASIPVLREGNVIHLANTSLEVAEACSGIRSLISLLTLGILFGYFTDPRVGARVTIALMTIPIAVISNGLRVAGTGFAAHFYGPEAAQGFFHTFSGWLVFVFAFGMLLVAQRLMQRVSPPSVTLPTGPVSAEASASS